MNKKIAIITGAGQGIGKYIAKNINNDFDLIVISKSQNSKKDIALDIDDFSF